jgi:putative transposase
MVCNTQSAYGVSERRACQVLAAPRVTHRYQSVADDQAPLRNRMKEIARVHVTWGYPRILP